jgi:hypothetical protein
MAMAATQMRDVPKFALVSDYTVFRVGKYPSVRVSFVECGYLFKFTALVQTQTTTVNGVIEVTLPDQGDQAIIGYLIADAAHNAIGTVESVARVETTPGTFVTTLTLLPSSSPVPDMTGTLIGIVDKMPVGTTAYEVSKFGRSWSITLNGENPQAMAQMIQLIGGAYFAAAKYLLGALGVSKTDAEILQAVQALGARGTNIDGLLAQQGEVLEQKRFAGLLPFAQVMGMAP